MSYHESGICRECGDILETFYEVNAARCSDCQNRPADEEDEEYGRDEMCEYCGGCLRPSHPDACTCDGEDELDQHAHRTYFGE